MRIGFDVSQTGRLKAGCGYFADSLIRHLAEIDPVNEYILYPTFGDVYWDPYWPTDTCQINRPNFRRGVGHRTFEAVKLFWSNPPSDLETYLDRPDIIHSNNFFCPIELQKARLVYTLHDVAFLENPEWTTEQNRTGCFPQVVNASLHADFIIAVSEYSRHHFLEIFPHYPEDRIVVVYPANRFSYLANIARPVSLPPLEPDHFWLNVGTLEPRKNHRHLLQAYARLKIHLGRTFPLVLAGGQGWSMSDFEKTIHDLGLRQDVLLLGYVDDTTLQWLYQNCFAFIYPSFFEGFGLPVLEAMSLGAPVIASSATSLPEIVGDSGLLVDPYSEEDISDKMRRLQTEQNLREQLKVHSLERSRKFSWCQTAKQVLEIYDHVLNSPPYQSQEGKDLRSVQASKEQVIHDKTRQKRDMRILRKPANFAMSPDRGVLTWLTSPFAAYSIGEPFFRFRGMRGRQDINLSQVNRVLVVRLDEIGDVVMTTPFLRELRRNVPNAWITLVVKPSTYNLVELCPYVNEILTYDWNTQACPQKLRRHIRALQLSFKHLWRRRYDLAILPRWDADLYHGSFVTYFSGAPWRVGHSENVIPHKRQSNNGYDRLFTHVLDNEAVKHEVEQNLDIIRFLGGQVEDEHLELWLGKEDEAFAEALLRQNGVSLGDLLIAMCPGAGHVKRQWPLSSYAELGLWLQSRYSPRLVVIGGPGEELLGQELRRELGSCVISVIGKITLRQTAAFLKRCSLYIGSDAGPMHMAAAVGVPVVEISCHPKSGWILSSNSPMRFGPWGVSHTVVQPNRPMFPCVYECKADSPHCILGVSVKQVKTAVVEQLTKGHNIDKN